MTAEQFVWWLHGFMDVTEGRAPTQREWGRIREHLATLFVDHPKPVGIKKPTKAQIEDILRHVPRPFGQRMC